MKRLIDAAKYVIGWPLSALAFFFIARFIYVNIDEAPIGLISPQPVFIFISLLLFIPFFLIRGLIWKRILSEKGYSLSISHTLYLWEISEVKRFVPGNIWSFLGRSIRFSQMGVSKNDIAHSLVVEVEFFLAGTFLFSVVTLPLYSKYLFPNILGILNHAFFYLLCVVLIAGFVFNKKFMGFLPKKINFIKKLLPEFSARTNIILVFYSFLSSAFFGLASYFSIISFFYISPQYLAVVMGLGVFSLLAGYLIILTPMGLGVREGILTLGLLRFLSSSSAGLASVLSRIVLVFSEIIFLILVFINSKLENRKYIKMRRLAAKHSSFIILLFLVITYVSYFSYASIARYNNYYTGRFDLGNMDQTVWNSAHGKIFRFTNPDGVENISRLAFHGDFILILLSPFYLIWEDPRTLLLIQTFVLGAGAFFVWKIANKLLGNKNLALMFSFLYLINPGLEYSNLYDFHAVTMATTFLLGAYYFLLNRRLLAFSFFAFLAGITKEQVWIVVALMALSVPFLNFVYAFFKNKKNRTKKAFWSVLKKDSLTGVLIASFSIFIFYFLLWIAIPSSRGAQHFALDYYSVFGNQPGEIVLNIVRNPFEALSIILDEKRLDFLKQILGPWAFLPVFFPFPLIFAMPDLLINLLSSNPNLHQIYYQYTAVITPFLAVSSILAFKYILKKNKNLSLYAALIIISVSLWFVYQEGPLPGSRKPNIQMITSPLENRTEVDNILDNLPADKSVAASNNAGSHLSQRENIYVIPYGMDKADYSVILFRDEEELNASSKEKDALLYLNNSPNHVLIKKHQGLFVFLRMGNINNPSFLIK